MSITRTQESLWDFESYLNSALEAAHKGKASEIDYFLKQAHQDAWFIGWEQLRERLEAIQAECVAVLAEAREQEMQEHSDD